MKAFRDIRVIPVVLIAIFGLAVLKIAGLIIDGGYVFDYQPNSTRSSWAQETLNFPGGKPETVDVTGSVQEKPKDAKPATAEPARPAMDPEPQPERVAPRVSTAKAIAAAAQAFSERRRSDGLAA